MDAISSTKSIPSRILASFSALVSSFLITLVSSSLFSSWALRNVNEPCIQSYYRNEPFLKNLKNVLGTEKNLKNVLGDDESMLPENDLVQTLGEIRLKKEQLENVELALGELKLAKKGLASFVDDLEKIEE